MGSERDRKSSSNIEEVYSEDGFEDESIGNTPLNSKPANKPVSSGWTPKGPAAEKKKADGSSNLDDFSVDNTFEDKYDDDDDFL